MYKKSCNETQIQSGLTFLQVADIQVNDPNGKTIHIASIISAMDGSFMDQFAIPAGSFNGKDIASMTPKQAGNFILDVVTELEREKLSGNYIGNYVKALKNWCANSTSVQDWRIPKLVG